MNDVILVRIARARTAALRRERGLERLRRAGYFDGERRPRVDRHWANR